MRFAVLGDPVAHSKSPAMHMAAYKALGLPHTYEAIRVSPGELAGHVDQLRRGVYGGLNVTVPHKQLVLGDVDEVSSNVRAIDAANTLVRKGDRVFAENTDAPALAAELRRLAPERAPGDWARSTAIVLGSGGASRAAQAALRTLGVARVAVRARKQDAGFEPLAPSADDGVALTVVQATSAGMYGADAGESIVDAVGWSDLTEGAIALDVVYAPPETPFLAAAKSRGLRAANGLGMLVEQGALAFELWLGVRAPRDVMRAALGAP